MVLNSTLRWGAGGPPPERPQSPRSRRNPPWSNQGVVCACARLLVASASPIVSPTLASRSVFRRGAGPAGASASSNRSALIVGTSDADPWAPGSTLGRGIAGRRAATALVPGPQRGPGAGPCRAGRSAPAPGLIRLPPGVPGRPRESSSRSRYQICGFLNSVTTPGGYLITHHPLVGRPTLAETRSRHRQWNAGVGPIGALYARRAAYPAPPGSGSLYIAPAAPLSRLWPGG